MDTKIATAAVETINPRNRHLELIDMMDDGILIYERTAMALLDCVSLRIYSIYITNMNVCHVSMMMVHCTFNMTTNTCQSDYAASSHPPRNCSLHT